MRMSPLIFEEGRNGEYAYDVFSWLLKNKIIYFGQELSSDFSNVICGQLLFAQKRSIDKIVMVINSPGGLVTDALAIMDLMNGIKTEVATVVVGEACSAAAMIAINGTPGKRYALRSSRMMLHDISGGAYGDSTDLKISYQETERLKEQLIDNLMLRLGDRYTRDQVEEEFLSRDNYISAQAAKDLGLIDHVLDKIDFDEF